MSRLLKVLVGLCIAIIIVPALLVLSTYVVPGTTDVTAGCGSLVVLDERPDWLPEGQTLVVCEATGMRYMVPTTLVAGHQSICFEQRQMTEFRPIFVPTYHGLSWRQVWYDTLVIDGQTVVTQLRLA